MITPEIQNELVSLLNQSLDKGYTYSLSMSYEDYKGTHIEVCVIDRDGNLIKPNSSQIYTVGDGTFSKPSQHDLEVFRDTLKALLTNINEHEAA